MASFNNFHREQSLLDAMSENAALIDQQGTIVLTNSSWNLFTQDNDGDESKCGVLNNYLDACLGGDEDAQAVHQGISQVLSGETDSFEHFYPCHSPTEQRWFVVKATPFRGDEEVIRALISHHNVTSLIERQHCIEARENRYSTVINSLVEGMVIQNELGEIETCNQAAEKLLGLSKADMVAQNSLLPKTVLIRQDGTSFSLDEFPPFVSLTYGKAVEGVIVGLKKSSDEISWLKINSQAIFEKPDSTDYSAVVTTIVSVTDEFEQNKKLKDIGERLELAISSTGIGIWDWNIKENQLIWDNGMFKLYGIKRENFSGVYEAWMQSLHPDDVKATVEHINSALEKNIPFEQGFRIVWPDKSIHIIKPFAIIKRDADGKPERMVGANQDVTALRLAQEALKEKEYRLQMLVKNLPVGAIHLDGDTLFMNQAAINITGYQQYEISSIQEWFQTLCPDKSEKLFSHYQEDRSRGFPEPRICQIQHKNGDDRWLEFNGFLYESGEAWLIVDITERKEAEQQLEHMAFHDGLTQLPNRANFEACLNKTLFNAQRHNLQFAVLLLDMDQFKRINDTYGHTVGDHLLVLFGNRLKNRLREGDMLARLGGDEFIVLVENINDVTEVAKLSQYIVDEMQRPYQLEENFEVIVSVSIGISLYPAHAQDSMRLLRNADTAMYLAKSKGRNTYCFYSESLTSAVEKRMAVENQLHKALDLKQFVLFYQPLVDMETEKICGAEALIRWRDENGELIYPDDFIPIAEETGLISPICEWVLHQACSDMKQWLSEGLPIERVSVNLSPVQFQKNDMAKLVQKVLAASELEPHHLDLEITENTLISQVKKVELAISTLSKMGVSFTIDDFGTGYSSLTYLKQFLVSRIKIDRTFVADILNNSSDIQLVNTIINMGHNLNLRVVAEGVETSEQFKLLKNLSCDVYQGYLMSPAVNSDAFKAFFQQNKLRLCSK